MSCPGRDAESRDVGTAWPHPELMRAGLVLAWTLGASILSMVIEGANGSATLNGRNPDDWLLAVLLLALAVAGFVVLEGARAVAAGRLLLAMGAGVSTALLAHATAVAALARGEDGPAVQGLVWVATWLFVPAVGLLVFVPAVWPHNRVTSRWLRPPTAVAIVALVALTAGQAVAPDHLDGVGPALAPVSNPLGISQASGLLGVVTGVSSTALAAYAGTVLIDLVLRYRRGDPELRSMLHPLVVVVTVLPVALAAGAGVAGLAGGQSLVGLVAAGGVLLLGGLAFALVRADTAVRRSERAVARTRHTVEVAEHERRRIRRELHDGLGPGLAALRLQLDSVRQALPSDVDEAADRLTRVEGTLSDALEELRRIVDGLRPAALDELGLGGALMSQGRAIGGPADHAPLVDVSIDPELPALPPAVEVALVRVSGEALTNAVRHGDPSRCTVTLGWQDGGAVLRVEDDGAGVTGGRLGHGHGLSTMRERVEELGGRLVVGSAQPHGTVVTAVIPSPR
jgi:two-component system, NarL family, sensor kinase